MRAYCSVLGTGWRVLVAGLALALLTACATAPAQQPQRTYDRIRGYQLYAMTRSVFAAEGYRSEPCQAGTVCVETGWREYDGARARRMYMARYERDPVEERYMLFFGVRLQERPPGATDWADKAVDFAADAEYPRILQALDQAVKRLGGVQY